MSRAMRHSSRVSKAAPDPANQVFRLSDMDVEEVSMVDRAANKKKFLVVKRAGDSMATEVQPNGKGGFSVAGGTNKAGKTGAAAKAGGAMQVPPGFKEAIAPIIDKASQALEALDEMVGASTPADDADDGTAPGVPSDFSDAITNVMNLLDRANSMWPTQAADPDADADPTDPSAADAGTAGGDDATTAMTMRLALDNVGKVFRRKGALNKALIQKIGAKMSKDRFTRLQQAVAQLATLVNEVGGAQDAQPPTGAGAPPVGKNGTQKGVPAGQDATVAALTAQVQALTGQLATLTKLATQDHTKVEQLAKMRGAPAGGPVEGTTQKSAEADVSWPMDMNAPITRDTVGKGESFFDD